MSNERDSQAHQIAELARKVEVADTDAFQDLSALSNNTQVDLVEIFEDEIVIEGDRFFGPTVWHVTLNYGDGADALTVSESFPGAFEGKLENNAPSILSMTADTSSFFE